LLVILILFVRCWYYSTSDSIPPDIKTIYLYPIENRTAIGELSETLYENIINAFIDNGRLKIVNNPDDADLILNITILNYENKPYTYGRNEDVSQYDLKITVSAKCINKKENKTFWSSSGLSNHLTYNYLTENEEEIKTKVTKNLSEDIVNKILTVW